MGWVENNSHFAFPASQFAMHGPFRLQIAKYELQIAKYRGPGRSRIRGPFPPTSGWRGVKLCRLEASLPLVSSARPAYDRQGFAPLQRPQTLRDS